MRIEGSKTYAVESICGLIQAGLYQPSPNPVPPEARKNIEVSDTPNARIAQVRIDVKTTHANDSITDLSQEERLPRTIKPVGPTLLFTKGPLNKTVTLRQGCLSQMLNGQRGLRGNSRNPEVMHTKKVVSYDKSTVLE